MTFKRLFFAILAASILAANFSLAQTKQDKQYPYVAKIIGENVNYRAGAGVNHYRCGRLSAPATVVVTGEQFGFARIIPPKGSFSWVAMQHVEKKDERTGEITADNTRIWAGSPYVSAVHSSSNQIELSRGDEVTFAGTPENNYYKILPPKGAHLWISAAHIEYVSPLNEYDQVAEQADTAAEQEKIDEPSPSQDKELLEGKDIALDKSTSEDIETEGKDAEPKQEQEAADKDKAAKDEQPKLPLKRSKEMIAYDKYLELSGKVQEEREKPIAVQNYEDIKLELDELISEPANGRAAAFGKSLLDLIERYETVQLADKTLRDKDSQLVKLRSEIRRDLKKDLEKIGVASDYVMTGTLAKSYVYTAESGAPRYAIKADDDTIIAYAVPVDAALYSKADRFIGKKVGLMGDIEPDSNTSKVLVYFLDVVELWQPKD